MRAIDRFLDFRDHVRAIVLTVVFQPACLVFLLGSFFIWKMTIFQSVTGTLIIATADHLLRSAIWFRAYATDAENAVDAIALSQKGYYFNLIKIDDLFAGKPINISSVIEKPVDILSLKPKNGYDNFSDLRAFLGPSRSLAMVPESVELTAVEKFCLLHELGHSAKSGHYQSFMGSLALYRLGLWYIPMIAMAGNYYVIIIIVLLYIWHYISDTNDNFVEHEADWAAYRLYKQIFGVKDLSLALNDIKRFFLLKSLFDDHPKNFVNRANSARMYRFLITRKNPTKVQKLAVEGVAIANALGNINFFAAIICAIIFSMTSRPDYSNYVIYFFGFIIGPHFCLYSLSKHRWMAADTKLWSALRMISFQDIIKQDSQS